MYDAPRGYSGAVGEHYSDAIEEPEDREMGFFDHLEELRWRIIKALIALVLCAILCGVFLNRIVEDIILGPATRLATPLKLQNTEPMGQVMLAVQVALISGLILAIPFIIWQFWGFVRPGLYERERRVASWVSIATIACFLGGVAFAYFVMIPASLGFSSDFTFAGVENRFTISAYFSFILGFILACGVVFEMPVVSYGLSRFGIITPAFLRKYRRHAIVVILIVAAIVTPTPDPFNQLLLAIPLYGLYELSIYVAVVAKRSRDAGELTPST
ncbi:MAG: twin-arginine translocase subunit TatC [Bacteroidetes bacterium]|nr:twin-arginine translocase subunit TatC [Bacteroidota bacterium]